MWMTQKVMPLFLVVLFTVNVIEFMSVFFICVVFYDLVLLHFMSLCKKHSFNTVFFVCIFFQLLYNKMRKNRQEIVATSCIGHIILPSAICVHKKCGTWQDSEVSLPVSFRYIKKSKTLV